nr:hypothetical protein [Cylindrospermopsis raciborskii]
MLNLLQQARHQGVQIDDSAVLHGGWHSTITCYTKVDPAIFSTRKNPLPKTFTRRRPGWHYKSPRFRNKGLSIIAMGIDIEIDGINVIVGSQSSKAGQSYPMTQPVELMLYVLLGKST